MINILPADNDVTLLKIPFLAQNLLTKKKDISTSPIVLEITSPDVPDLTLIDLPGITEVAFGGQDEDIVDQVMFSNT